MRRALLLAAMAIVGLSVGGVFWAGDFLTKPAPARTGVPEPALHARSLSFDSVSGVKLSAWFASGSSGAGAILLLHSVRSNKRSMLPRAQFLSALGFSVLLVDLQAHGESEGERISFGHREAADVRASVEKLQELAPGERLGVLGVSLGAASLLLSDVQPLLGAVVLESLYPTIEDAVANRLRLYFGVVGPWLSPLLLAQLSPRLGVAPSQLRPIERISLLRCPVLVVQGTEDRHSTIQEARRLFAAAPSPKEFYALAGAAHVDLHAFGGKEYERRIGGFFARHLRPTLAVTR
jgi:alpha-beta hydrolase superfamily lysophospholipase